MMDAEFSEYDDAYDRWEDEMLARIRDRDAMSDEETDTESEQHSHAALF